MELKNNNFSSIIILFAFLLFLPFFFVVHANIPEVDDESSFSYVVGAPNGPENWGNLNRPNWSLCGSGRSQSPINIYSFRSIACSSLGDLHTQYKPAPARIRNRGHDIEVEWNNIGDAGSIIINGTEFELAQCHWHIPSEHTLNGIRFDMELHIVHYSSQKDIAVVSILYNIGRQDPFLARLAPFIASATRNLSDLGIVDLSREITYIGRQYYRYNGSLTTPPCSENVTWTILNTVKTVSSQQLISLRNAVNDGNVGNARPLQQSNGRPTCFYWPRPIF